MDLQARIPTTGQPVLATQSTRIALDAYEEAHDRYIQAWVDLRYADMGSAALDMRDLMAETTIAQQSLFV